MTDTISAPDPGRVERRYHEAAVALEAWRMAAHAQVEAEYRVRSGVVLADRDRDFQTLGLNGSGTGPA